MDEQYLTECELLVMKVIWDSKEPLSIQDIYNRVNEKYNKNWKRQTVSVFLNKIVAKNFLYSERKGRQFFYFPVVSQEEYGDKEITKCVEFWGTGRFGTFLKAFTKDRALTADEKAQLKKLL